MCIRMDFDHTNCKLDAMYSITYICFVVRIGLAEGNYLFHI